MRPATIIQQAKNDGLILSLSDAGGISFQGNRQAAEKWTPTIREYKLEIIRVLQKPLHFLWRIALADGKILTVSFSPEADQDEVMALYPQAVTIKPVIEERPAAEPPMTDEEEQAILVWLARIGEDDPVTIGEVIDRCRSHTEAREYFLGRAKEAHQ